MGEWEHRELCPDGGCVGVIGKSGTCSVCGKKGSGKAATDTDTDADADAADAGTEVATATATATATGAASSALGSSEWDQRKLCPDGSCVGVIGAKGRCSVCGRAGA